MFDLRRRILQIKRAITTDIKYIINQIHIKRERERTKIKEKKKKERNNNNNKEIIKRIKEIS